MNNELTGWKNNAATMSIVAMFLQAFAGELIGHGLNGGIFDEATVSSIKAKCVGNLKNMDVVGADINDEADFLGKSVELFEQMADMAITSGWKLKKV